MTGEEHIQYLVLAQIGADDLGGGGVLAHAAVQLGELLAKPFGEAQQSAISRVVRIKKSAGVHLFDLAQLVILKMKIFLQMLQLLFNAIHGNASFCLRLFSIVAWRVLSCQHILAAKGARENFC